MKIIKNYKGGLLKEKVWKVLFKYKGFKSILATDEESWIGRTVILECANEVEVLCKADFIFKIVDSVHEKFKNGCEISENEKYTFETGVYFLTKFGLIDNDMDNGMIVFIK